jgi:hypothetical protein
MTHMRTGETAHCLARATIEAAEGGAEDQARNLDERQGSGRWVSHWAATRCNVQIKNFFCQNLRPLRGHVPQRTTWNLMGLFRQLLKDRIDLFRN